MITVNTKPLQDALNLGILNANVSAYYSTSTIAQVQQDVNSLIVNLEAASIVSELCLKGTSDDGAKKLIFVDSLLLKNLVATLDTAQVSLEFQDSALVVHSGKSKFTLPKVVDGDVKFTAPTKPGPGFQLSDVDREAWKFVRDHQLYAIAMSFIPPVYTKAWVGESGDVLIGDVVNGVFTRSKQTPLGSRCLLTDTIINLLTALPGMAKIMKLVKSYVIQVEQDSFSFWSEFTPKSEEDPDMGDYMAEVYMSILPLESKGAVVDIPQVQKALSQAGLMSEKDSDVITVEVSGNILRLTDRHVDAKVEIQGDVAPFKQDFKTGLLRTAVNKCPESTSTIFPSTREGEVTGIVIQSGDLVTVVSCVE